MGSKYDKRLKYEEEFHADENRLFRKEKKRVKDADRSKYKKTDQDKRKKQQESLADKTGLSGRVLAIYPAGVEVEYEGALYLCGLKGALKKEKSRAKNLVAVGDFVLFEKREDNEGIITYIKPRSSILSRADNLHRRKEQLIAVNVDQVLITLSACQPTFKPFLIDRYIIAATNGQMAPVIVINKVDTLEEGSEEQSLILECARIYKELGYPIVLVSTYTGEGLLELKELMKNKSSVFSGQSGVGKSSLINAVTGLSLKTGDVVQKTYKGAHTTTTTRLIPLEEGGFCVDTPGIKSFGIWNTQAADIQGHFEEIASEAKNCKFPNCLHLNEEGCAVIEAVEQETLSAIRYASYCALMDTALTEHKLR